MAADYDSGLDDLVFLFGLAVVAYVFVQKIREQSAGYHALDTLHFDPTPPAQDPLDSLADILIPMKTSAEGQAFIKQAEGLSLTPYPDAKGQSVGYGHFIQPGDNITGAITAAQAEALFQKDLAVAENAVNNAVTVQLSQSQFDACVDLAFNIGAAAFAGSTLVQDLNAGDFQAASQQFGAWDMSGGQVNQDLQNRRAGDQQEFNAGGTPA